MMSNQRPVTSSLASSGPTFETTSTQCCRKGGIEVSQKNPWLLSKWIFPCQDIFWVKMIFFFCPCGVCWFSCSFVGENLGYKTSLEKQMPWKNSLTNDREDEYPRYLSYEWLSYHSRSVLRKKIYINVPKSCLYQYYHPIQIKMPVLCSIWFFFRLLSLWSTIYDTEWYQPFHLLQAGAKHTSKKNTIHFPRRIFILQRSRTNKQAKKTTRKVDMWRYKWWDSRSNNPSTWWTPWFLWGSLARVKWEIPVRTSFSISEPKSVLPKNKGKSQSWNLLQKEDPPLFSGVNLLNCSVSNIGKSTCLFSSAVQRLGCNTTIPSVWPFG